MGAGMTSNMDLYEPISFCGIKLKRNVKRRNMFAIFYTFFLVMVASGYLNVQIVYLLRDEKYFGLTPERQGRIISDVLIIALIACALWSIIAGYLYDIFGRRELIFTSGILMALFIVLCPYTAPNVLYLKIVRALFAMACTQISCHPLILDYIKKESRGKAAAL